MGMSGAASGGAGCGRGEYMRIPEDVDAIKEAVKEEGECPRLLRCRAIRWWAQIAVLGVFLAGAAVAAAIFLGPLVISKVRPPYPGQPPPPLSSPPLLGFIADARSFDLCWILSMRCFLSILDFSSTFLIFPVQFLNEFTNWISYWYFRWWIRCVYTECL